MAFSGYSGSCRVLDMPPEIRNMIYRLVLSDPSTKVTPNSGPRVWIDRHNLIKPPLLHTCSQIRTEASSIYYMENTFDVVCPGLDPTNMMILLRHAKGFHLSMVVHGTEVEPTWANAFRWMEAYYTRECGRLRELDDPDCVLELWNSVAKMFDMIDVLEKSGMRWREVKKVLELTKDIAALSEDWEWVD